MTDLARDDEADVCNGCVVSIEITSFYGDVSRGSPLVEVGRTTSHREGDGFVPVGWGVRLFGTGIEHTTEQEWKIVDDVIGKGELEFHKWY